MPVLVYKLLGLVVILDAVLSLASFVPNNHSHILLEAGRWVRLAIGIILII